jgi:CheY-like chemotaxis protein
MRVLLVNDDLMQLMVLKHIMVKVIGLRDENVKHATNGEEAVKFSLNQHFHVILIDIDMPFKNGYDACIKLKQLESLNGL